MFVSGRWPRPRLGDKLGWSWRNAEESFSKPLPMFVRFSPQVFVKKCVSHDAIT